MTIAHAANGKATKLRFRINHCRQDFSSIRNAKHVELSPRFHNRKLVVGDQLIFGARSSLVVDPSEERIQTEFEGVTRTYLPLHSIIRIDEVEKQGVSKVISAEGSNVTQFPMPMYTPPGEGGKGGSGDK